MKWLVAYERRRHDKDDVVSISLIIQNRRSIIDVILAHCAARDPVCSLVIHLPNFHIVTIFKHQYFYFSRNKTETKLAFRHLQIDN